MTIGAKDKATMRIDRRGILAGALALGGGTALNAAPRDTTDWHALAEDVKAEMAWSFDLYRARAWGKDEIKPVTGTVSSFPLKGHHLGLSLIEALDTLWVMGLDSRFQDGVDWVKATLDF
ncbi:MAG: glycoside hydrolase family 47 protein, partial [Janthinobacterium lividum]